MTRCHRTPCRTPCRWTAGQRARPADDAARHAPRRARAADPAHRNLSDTAHPPRLSIINNFDNNHNDESNEAAVLQGVAEAVATPAAAVGAADAELQPPSQQPSEPPPHSAREESFDYVRRMGRGINLGNGLSAPQEGDWQPAVDESYFDDVAAAGFNSVRIPVRWDQHITAEAPYTVDPEWLARVAQVAQWALSRGLVTILNAHGEHWLIQVSCEV